MKLYCRRVVAFFTRTCLTWVFQYTDDSIAVSCVLAVLSVQHTQHYLIIDYWPVSPDSLVRWSWQQPRGFITVDIPAKSSYLQFSNAKTKMQLDEFSIQNYNILFVQWHKMKEIWSLMFKWEQTAPVFSRQAASCMFQTYLKLQSLIYLVCKCRMICKHSEVKRDGKLNRRSGIVYLPYSYWLNDDVQSLSETVPPSS